MVGRKERGGPRQDVISHLSGLPCLQRWWVAIISYLCDSPGTAATS